jgi:CubicO group peptidase (beta-lactamase class C family)
MTRSAFFPTFALAWLALIHASPLVAKDAPKSQVLAPALQRFVEDGTIPGAVVLVASPDKVLALETLGVADLRTKEPMRADAMFWIASMTKPMTAMALMMCVEEGKLSIDDPVEKHLPEFRNQWLIAEKSPARAVVVKPKRPVTVKDLLTHTSGLTSNSPLDKAALDTLTLREAVITYALTPLRFEPGSEWSYCNPGINTLGRLVEVASGKPFAEFMQERFFDPLGMKDTTFWPTE